MPLRPAKHSTTYANSKTNQFSHLLGKRSLRVVLIVPFVLQVIGAVGIVGYLSFKNGQKAVNQLAAQLGTEVSDRIEQHLSSYLNTPRQLGEQNADAIEQGFVNSQNLEELGRFFWKQMQLFNNVGYISYATEAGEYAGAGYYLDPNQVGIDEMSSKRYGNRKSYTYATDNQGNRTNLKAVEDYNFKEEAWYSEAMRARKPIWSSVSLWEGAPNIISIAFSAPVHNTTNKPIGVVGIDLRLSQISKFLQQLHVSRSGKTFVLERNGLIIASSSTEQPFRLVNGTAERLKAIDSQDPLIQATARFLSEQFGEFHKITNTQQLNFWLNRQRQFIQVTPWRDQRGLDWLVVVAVPESDFMAQINANTRHTIVLCLIALVVAIVLGILTARRIAGPIERIIQASEDLADGNLAQYVESSSIIELGKLSNSFNSMAAQLKESFETLEDKVEERTTELAQANAQISTLNQKLKTENLRMAAEIDVARQIQRMLLPKLEELEALEGLDIAGFMEPADEVGGDYYDVLSTDGVVTIGIGDVTGHGLESGILMLMTQTAVRTLKEIREHDPVRFLDTLNHTIYKNLQRMNSDRNLTLAVLNYSDGTLSISGQHEEIILVRNGGDIERIDTIDLGFPIGLDDEIAEFIGRMLVELQPGDGIVLYTDGVTEARDMAKKEYGIGRLCSAISQNWDKSAQGIQEAVIANVRQHIGQQKVFDDITLLVLKRHDTTVTEQQQLGAMSQV